LNVEVYDSVWPNNKQTGILTININRNPGKPEFTQDVYERTINADFPVGDIILTVNATDSDQVRTFFNSYVH
jgi:hypothetical protein